MSIKIMSFNLRMDTEHDGINSFTNRFERVLSVINDESPDIVGFQEVRPAMKERLQNTLKGYTLLGCGRGWDYKDESMLIGFKYSLFECISMENVWLSETPNVPGSRYGGDHSGCPRMYTSLLLKHKDVAKPFRFINTHLDHEGANGRLLEATQLMKAISAYTENGESFILTGDFNAKPESPEIQHIISHKGVCDCTKSLAPTFHEFGKRIPENRCIKIDYIFTNAKCENSYIVKDEPVNGQYYSDHYAVCAFIEL